MKDTTGMRVQSQRPRLTTKVELKGGQDRLRQMILYVAKKCASAQWMGLTKLNKILWKADFDSFAARNTPVTGRAYQRLELGPAPKEMPPVLNEMIRDEILHLELTDFGDHVIEKRPIANAEPRLENFTSEDLRFVDAAISYYWDKTGKETSDDSHGVAWRSRENKTTMYYELAFLSDAQVGTRQRAQIIQRLQPRSPEFRRSK